jgi:hypothetical protein
MAAFTETTSNITEFAGNFKVAIVEVDVATQSGATTVSIDEMSTVVAAFGQIKENTTIDCASLTVSTTATTSTQLSCILWEDDHITQCTQNALDFYVLAIGY